MASIQIGSVILSQFRVDEFIDAGGMGSVYRVWDLKRNVPLAMKVLHSDLADDPTMFKRFKREARALEKLAHPNIVPFYGIYQTKEFVFLLERFIDGPTLKDVLKNNQGKPITEKETIIYVKAICSALGYAHANGVVHCDVKAANVMIDQGGSIYLADFGIARHADSTTTNIVGAGTPAYMAPEQILSKSVSPATDIYALGVLLYEMLTGQRPFKGTEKGTENGGLTANERIRYAHLHVNPPDPRTINPFINPRLASVIIQALSKAPDDRFQSPQALLIAICSATDIPLDTINDRVYIFSSNREDSSIGNFSRKINGSIHQSYIGTPIASPTDQIKPSYSMVRKNTWFYFVLGGIALVVLSIVLVGKSGADRLPATMNRTDVQSVAVIQTTASLESSNPSFGVEPSKKHSPTIEIRNTPTREPTVIQSCPGAEPQRVKKGDRVYVCTKSDRLLVKDDPLKEANEIIRIYPGTEVVIIDGPRCDDNSSWWRVQVPKGIRVNYGGGSSYFTLSQMIEGWVREGSDNIDRYYICSTN